ncbi:MAG: D-2-hydroxyacid dehydrogenase [Firmicutes bacterium]|nr:D-2-hydroxyacid dehydrogenase [Bacillota bacterium]
MKIVITRNIGCEYLDIIRKTEGVELFVSEDQSEIVAQMADADILLWFWHKDHEVGEFFKHAPRLKWIHSVSTGVDQLLRYEIPPQVLLTRTATSQNIPIAEHCFALMLALSRRINIILSNQRQRYWERMIGDELYEHTIVVVGTGNIGREIMRRAAAFGMRVIGVDLKPPEDVHFDEFIPVDRLDEALGKADYLVVCLPLTKQTKGLIGVEEFKKIKEGATLINVSRGGIVSERAMIEALKSKRLKAAACDVFEIEPLPKDSELYSLDNVIISPHMAGLTPYMVKRAVLLFCENLERFIAGEPLLYQIDKSRGF